jgi:pimeloyl-ACP methyl ester carboxylesterase
MMTGVPGRLWEGKRVQILGNSIFYRDEGKGPDLLLVHGWTGNSFQWRWMLPELARTHRVLALDLPGCGLSDKPPLNYTIAEYLQHIHEFVRELRLGPFVLVGTSFGGFMSTRYCLEFPDDVRALILLNSSGIQARYHWIFKLCGLPVLGYLMPYVLLIPRELKYWFKARIYPRLQVNRQHLDAHRHTTLTLRSWAGLRATVKGYTSVTEQDLVDHRLAEIRCPTLICWGEQDVALPKEMADVFHGKISGSRLRMIPGCGHNIPEDRPKEALGEMTRFLGDLHSSIGINDKLTENTLRTR